MMFVHCWDTDCVEMSKCERESLKFERNFINRIPLMTKKSNYYEIIASKSASSTNQPIGILAFWFRKPFSLINKKNKKKNK